MRFKKLTCGIAVLGMTAGMSIALGGTAHAESTTIYPYADWSFGAETGATTLVGSTDSGMPDAQVCLDYPAKGATGQTPITSLSDTGHYSGRVNQVVVNPGTQLDELIVLSDLLTATPVCTNTGIPVSATGSFTNDNLHHKGTVTITTTASLQSGLLATSDTVIRVHCNAGQTVTAPSGGAILSAVNATVNGSTALCNVNNGSTVDMKSKNITAKTKSSLNLSACNDVDSVVDLTETDSISVERTGEFTGGGVGGQGQPHSYVAADKATKDLITIRECAQNVALVTGKPFPITVKVSGANANPDTLDLLYAQTANPQLWDTTRGTSCKSADTTTRAMFCKGDYSYTIPLVIGVRGLDSGSVGIDPKGLLHPEGPLSVATATVTVS